MNDTQLLREYRFNRQSILRLTETLEPNIEYQTRRISALPTLLQVFISSTFQSVIGDVFNVHKSTVCRAVHRVALALCRRIDTWNFLLGIQ